MNSTMMGKYSEGTLAFDELTGRCERMDGGCGWDGCSGRLNGRWWAHGWSHRVAEWVGLALMGGQTIAWTMAAE